MTNTHPSHYTRHTIEAIDIIEDYGLNFSRGNIIKYVLRAPFKGQELDDLYKARWYLDREIANALEKQKEEANGHEKSKV